MTSNQHHPQSADASSHAGSFGSVILYRLLIAVSVILVLLVLGVLVIRKVVRSKIPASTFAEIHRLETTTLSLPPDWHQPAVLPPVGVLDFHKTFEMQMDALRAKHDGLLTGNVNFNSFSPGGPLSLNRPATEPGLLKSYETSGTVTEAQRTSFSLLLADLQPVIDQTSAAVHMEGYSMETDNLLLPIHFFDMQVFSKLMFIVAEEQARQGACLQAIESALLPLRLIKRPEQSYLITHLMAISITTMATESAFRVCQTCDDPQTLRYALESLNDIYDDVLPGDITDWFNETLVALRFAAAYGYPVDLAPQTHANFVRQYGEVWTIPYFEHLAASLPSSDPRGVAANKRIGTLKAGLASSSRIDRWTKASNMSPARQKLFNLVVGVDPFLLQHTMMGPSMGGAIERAHIAKASVDLVRLTLAQRLAELEGTASDQAIAADRATADGTAAGDVTTATKSLAGGIDAATITIYLTPPPVDPFTSGTYAYSSALKRHYSTGPDLDDDKAAIKYDATNGTTSNGDIWLTGRTTH